MVDAERSSLKTVLYNHIGQLDISFSYDTIVTRITHEIIRARNVMDCSLLPEKVF